MVEATETKTEETTEAKQVTETKPETVSKERMDEVNAENKTLKEQNELLQQNQALISANVPAAPAAPAFDIYKEVGLEGPEDIPNVEQQRKINAYHQAVSDRKISQLRFVADHPDFPKLVGTSQQIQSGQWAEPLMKAIKANPTLMNTIVNSADPYAAAYAVAKIQADKAAEGDTTKTTKTEAQAAIDEAVENANRVKTSANTKGGEGLSEEGRTAAMSDADFIKEFNKIGGDL